MWILFIYTPNNLKKLNQIIHFEFVQIINETNQKKKIKTVFPYFFDVEESLSNLEKILRLDKEWNINWQAIKMNPVKILISQN